MSISGTTTPTWARFADGVDDGVDVLAREAKRVGMGIVERAKQGRSKGGGFHEQELPHERFAPAQPLRELFVGERGECVLKRDLPRLAEQGAGLVDQLLAFAPEMERRLARMGFRR